MENKAIAQNKNLNIEIIRSLSLLMILLFHFGGLVHGNDRTHHELFNFILNLGGEVGVTLFFIISGYGIFHSLNHTFEKGGFSYRNFILRRLQRLAPSYYLGLIFMLCIGDGAWYLGKEHILNIIMHFLFLHGFVPSYSGAIIGSAWYLSTQFILYLIAPLCFLFYWKHEAKHGVNVFVSLFVSIILTVASKFFMFHYVVSLLGFNNSYNFWAGRTIFICVLDNFVMGMTIAFIEKNCKPLVRNNCIRMVLAILSACMIYVVSVYLGRKGIHTDNLYGYTFHSVLAFSCSLFIYFASSIRLSDKTKQHNLFIKVLLWLSKYSYAIFLLHLEIARNIMTKSPIFIMLKDKHKILAYLLLYLITISFGYILHNISEKMNLFQITTAQNNKNKENIK
ncbi:acyltransferase family protein [Treponema saccharophilum]|uniref:Acyltransferase 3 n=1 Tax=Treponema saccharophilum DSM 2985 TaxID=907348 RepID=H7EI37_9SPIR|nr:acyltransferase [Treponema saccharophilum]EIC02716.1 acyltransferase 3 [Treponema saccharophilum DSM 2985]BDC96130.1 hypothetical protein TRSA_12290 [Treponema saccharophilum]